MNQGTEKHSRWIFTSRYRSNRGFTLVEVLIATVMTLLMMAALAQGFKRLSDSITESRARLALSDRIRSVALILKQDLENCTVRPNPPMSSTEATGYFEYYDGPMSDSTFHDPTLGSTIGTINNRFSDCDDVLMFTVRANGEPFLGKVPLALVKGAAAFQAGTSIALTPADWSTMVTISSEYAEIAYFALPTPAPDIAELRLAQLSQDATVEAYNPNTGLPIFQASDMPPVTLGSTPAANVYPSNTGTMADPRIPTSYTLYRRVNLIRPDLNIISGGFVHVQDNPTALAVEQFMDPLTSGITQEMVRMQAAHQRCDLSLRRVWTDPTSTLVAANSLQDLASPENRFAHTVIPLGADSSMPILATSLPIFHARNTVTSSFYTLEPDVLAGFLRPEFVLGRMGVGEADPINPMNTMDPSDSVPDYRSRLGEDVLLPGAIGFDVKALDETAERVFVPGLDGLPGIANFDDNGNGTIDELMELGSADSDDELLIPGDTGYWTAAATGIADRGAFVDLAWGWKRRPNATFRTDASQFSGESPVSITTMSPFLIKSGVVRANASAGLGTPIELIYQPRYDTWTDTYEVDSYSQTDGLWISGPYAVGATTSPGMNGVDDNGDGVADDENEKETSPPFPVPLKAIQISLRLEDPGTGLIQQLSVVHEFVSR